MQPGADRPNRTFQHRGRVFVAHFVHFAKDYNFTVVLRQGRDGLADAANIFARHQFVAVVRERRDVMAIPVAARAAVTSTGVAQHKRVEFFRRSGKRDGTAILIPTTAQMVAGDAEKEAPQSAARRASW